MRHSGFNYCLFSLKVVCEACGQELKPEWRLCPYCSAKVTKMTVVGERERRVPHLLPGAGGPAVAEAPAAVAAAVPAAGGRAPGKAPKILVVDDDDAIRRLGGKSLEQPPG